MDGALTRLIAILEGVPLAIELAAPLLAVASPEDLAAKLEQRLPLLSTSTSEDTASRRTMRGAIAWSYDLLPENERRLFRYLGVFRGSFGLDAVAAVATDGPTQPLDTLQVLATLVQQNLLRSGYASGFLRLEFSAFMREYAAEQLEARGEFDQVMERLAGHCLAVAETFRDLATTQTAEMLARYEPVLPNFDAVLAWALRTKRIALGLQLANAAWKYWWLRGTGLVALSWLRALLAVVESGVAALDDALATRSYNTAAAAAEACGQYHDAAAFAEKALPIARRSGDTQTVANLLTGIGIRASEHGDFEGLAGSWKKGSRFGGKAATRSRSACHCTISVRALPTRVTTSRPPPTSRRGSHRSIPAAATSASPWCSTSLAPSPFVRACSTAPRHSSARACA